MGRQREKALRILNQVEPNGELLDTEKALDAIVAFGREMKISGSKSFARLVKQMREKQNAYFETGRNSSLKKRYLREAQKLETRVDRAWRAILK